MTPETRAKISASMKAYWTQARLEAKRIKDFDALDAKLKPMRMRAWDECLVNKWPRCDIDRSAIGWDGEICWDAWPETFEPPSPTEYDAAAKEWFAMQAEGNRLLEVGLKSGRSR